MVRLPELKERPVINSVVQTTTNMPELRRFSIKPLVYWIRRTPECIGILNRITNDIVTRIHINAVSNKTGGRPISDQNLIDKARNFSARNLLKHKLRSLVFDWLMTGDFYTAFPGIIFYPFLDASNGYGLTLITPLFNEKNLVFSRCSSLTQV